MTSHDGRSRKATRKPNQLKEQKVKSLRFFKPTLAHNLGLHPSFRSAVAGELPGERNVYMYDSIQLSKTASSRTTSQVTWPNDNKAVGNCVCAPIAGLRPAGLILARRIAFPLLLLGAALVLIQPCAGQSGTWTATRSLANAGFNIETATLLPNGKVLVAGSYPVVVDHPYPHVSYVASAELYDPASGTWAVTGIPVTGVSSRTATLLPSGKVLVAGASAELYDPASGTGRATGSCGTALDDGTVALLPNGKVLVAGGENSAPPFSTSAELYDPASGTWTTTGSLNTARAYGDTATLLPNGKVLVAGGMGLVVPGHLASAELYDPASGTWAATGSLVTARFDHTATLLPDGNVLLSGGIVASAELYLPATAVPGGGAAIVADFNNDSHPDFVVRNPATRQTAIWYLNNNVRIGGVLGPTLPAGWGLRGAADFNSDSHPDYGLFNSATRQTAIWDLSGPMFIGGALGPSPPNGWALVATAELNGDGKPDYVLYNAATRQTAIWYLNNNVFIGGAPGPTLPLGWTLS